MTTRVMRTAPACLRILATVIAIVAGMSGRATAQGETPPAVPPPAAPDSVFARAQKLVASGNGAAGRLLVDSVLAATDPDAPGYAEALYWRAALASSTDDAARDYRRIVVEYPTSPRTADALLALAQLEVASGDRSLAATHLERFLLENPKHPQRAKAGLLLAQISFDQNDLVHGCAAVKETLTEIPPDAVEMRNQLQYYLPRCTANDVNPASQLPLNPQTKAGSVAGGSSSADTTRAGSRAASSKGKYTLQIAAYASKSDAAALVKRLKARGFDARVVDGTKLYRVRVGHYPSRAAAGAAQTELKAKKIAAFVTESGADDR